MNTDNFNDFFGSEPPTGPPKPRTEVPDEMPATLGRYQVVRQIGKGAFGIVYECRDPELGHRVAIKVPRRRFQIGGEDGYIVEAGILAGLDHPNIVPLLHVERMDDGRLLIVYKFIEGSDLKARMDSGRISLPETCRLIATIADALHHAHLQILVHRDVKPANILVDKSGRVYLADFGLALREEDFGKGSTGAGTIPYMSPEQARSEGHRVDGRSDIFSLGTVFYEMLTGRRPFTSNSMLGLLDEIIGTDPRPPRQIDDTIPKEVERICLKALAKQAPQRYNTAKDMAEDLLAFVELPKAATFPTPTSVSVPVRATSSNVAESSIRTTAVVPRGLRSFDAGDADFFLELLPGPRDRHGVPDAIRNWQRRIVRTDDAFSIGLIYGPSGCGKSSLVKAGLLPLLPNKIVPIYVEAAPQLTEERLLTRLRRQFPALPEVPLDESITLIRRGVILDPGKKLLLVVDQFEQWLHSRVDRESNELVNALRQCEGSRVQCLLLVRDDFWMAITNLMRELEIGIADDINAAAVDLFDVRHAGKVLTMLGRAHNALPPAQTELSEDQERFVEQSVTGLSQDGKLIPVRLALFSEMVKGRHWSPGTLKAIGGIEGVGVTFLEEAFSATTAPAQNRIHELAARAVLKSLLPEPGKDIKGNMRSHGELLAASGYKDRPKDFDDLLRILHRELRLVSPADPEGVPTESSSRVMTKDEHYYQLTHDYLVPALRDWLTRKQRETRKGRAELSLADQADLWVDRPENRNLPTFWQWANIRAMTEKAKWNEPQKKMMRKAGWRHIIHFAAIVCVLALIGFAGSEWLDDQEAKGLVHRLLENEISAAPEIIKQMSSCRRQVNPMLLAALAEFGDKDPEKGLRARLGLLPVDESQVDNVYKWLLKCDAKDFAAIRKMLGEHKQRILKDLWTTVENDSNSEKRFRAACALAHYDFDNKYWKENVFKDVASTLVGQSVAVIAIWMDELKPISKSLLAPLQEILASEISRDDERSTATKLYERFASNDPTAIENLALDMAKEAAIGDSRETKLDSGGRRANIGIALFQLGKYTVAAKLLQPADDPTARTFMIHRLNPQRVSAASIIRELGNTTLKPSERYCLLLALGEYDLSRLTSMEFATFKTDLLATYHDHPDAGVHSAAEWLARRLKLDIEIGDVDEEYRRLDVDICRDGIKPPNGRKWYVNSLGMTMILVNGVEFWRGETNSPQKCKLNRSVAISSTDVTVEQFWKVMAVGKRTTESAISAKIPMNTISWYQAAEYCNRLSKEDGIREDQWAYLPKDNKFATGMSVVPVSEQRIGYRLPTLFEYDLAVRAGSRSTYSIGESDTLVDKYAWHIGNANSKCHPVGLLRPNLYGIFDAHGNISIWCQGHPQKMRLDEDGILVETADITVVNDATLTTAAGDLSKWRPTRGAAFHTPYTNMKSSETNLRFPSGFIGESDQRKSIGLRVIRTIHN